MDYFNPSSNQVNLGQFAWSESTSQAGPSPQPNTSPAGPSQASSSGAQPSSGASNANPNAKPEVSGAPRIRRRNRMITSCLECRRRKLKCNKSHPCTNCVKFARDCVFLAPALDQASQLKLTEIKEKVGSLERLLERNVAKSSSSLGGEGRGEGRGEGSGMRDLDDDDGLPANEDERDLEPTPLATVDAAYRDDGEDDDLLDLGIQLGKMRITERIGGFFRPKLSQELEFTMTDTFMTGNKGLSTDGHPIRPVPSLPTPLPPPHDWLKPGPAYIAPTSGFFFGQGTNQASLIDFLPSRLAADRLIKQYFVAVHPIAHILHRPTFAREYDTFWDEVSLGIEPPSSVQTIVFAAMFSGVVSMDEASIMRDFGVSKASLIDNFRLGTETALGRANFLRTTKIETLQAFVMYLIPLCRAEVSRAHSVLIGAAIRMAECMGLHRDGEAYGMNPLETHVRRLIWHQLCFLDIRTCEAQGPRPTIRRDDFDTKPPLNVDDVDLHAAGKPPVGADRWTDATFCLVRFEINEMMRTIWIDRPRIERQKTSLTAVLSKIETFKANMAAKYDHLIDDRIPVQKMAKYVKALLISRLYIMVLHRYHNSVVSPMPERLRNVMLAAGTTVLETSVSIDTLPDLRSWAWYSGALQQYHTAFLLLVELYIHPDRKQADRIWTCLDYIFECSPTEHRATKAKNVISELQAKTAVYQSVRGMRAPVVMDKALSMQSPSVVDSTSPKALHFGDHTRETPEPADSIGRAPMQFAGMPNEWALPSQNSAEANSDSNGVSQTPDMPSMVAPGTDDLMADIDWDAFDALFPPQGEDIQAEFRFPPMPGAGPF